VWMPAFLERTRGIPRSEATVSFGAIVVITGFIGTFVGGWLGDYCAKYSRRPISGYRDFHLLRLPRVDGLDDGFARYLDTRYRLRIRLRASTRREPQPGWKSG